MPFCEGGERVDDSCCESGEVALKCCKQCRGAAGVGYGDDAEQGATTSDTGTDVR